VFELKILPEYAGGTQGGLEHLFHCCRMEDQPSKKTTRYLPRCAVAAVRDSQSYACADFTGSSALGP
jgi:hypothetical protein